ncbi:MAG: hypothetical protein IJX05_06140 [Clostridia bacterium]|nr:hypothetical protein [Clostridia bacterium]
MRVRRSSRRELKNKLEALTAENLALKSQLKEMEPATTVADSPANESRVAVKPATENEPISATPIICGGFPTRVSAVKAHDLKEAKALAMEYLARC